MLEGITNKDNFIWGAEKSRRSSKWFNCFPIQVHILYTHLQKSVEPWSSIFTLWFDGICKWMWLFVIHCTSFEFRKEFCCSLRETVLPTKLHYQMYGSFFRRIFGILIRHLGLATLMKTMITIPRNQMSTSSLIHNNVIKGFLHSNSTRKLHTIFRENICNNNSKENVKMQHVL